MDPDFLWILGIGFAAQMVDGALGMAYGVTANSFLLTLGFPPAAASASTHAAEVFTSGVSGLSHLAVKNVDYRLFKRLLVPGAVGAVLGAYFLTILPLPPVRFVVSLYLAVMGMMILGKGLKRPASSAPVGKRMTLLGLAGGFFDAMGGGGWGPIVTSTLVARGGTARMVIGSVNLAEFFVALAASATFFLTIGHGHWWTVLGLVLGGVPAAPLAAVLCRKIPNRVLMLLVGLLIVLLSLRAMIHALGWLP